MADKTIVKSTNFIKSVNLPLSEDFILETIQSYRVLRNYCANGRFAQNQVLEDKAVLSKTKEVVVSLLENNEDSNKHLCLLVALQFIANSLVDNKENQREVWDGFANILSACLDFDDPKVKHCVTMIIYNVLKNNEDFLHEIDSPLNSILDLTQNDQTAEFSVFIIELLIYKTNYMVRHYEKLKTDERLIVLSIVESTKNRENEQLPQSLICFLGQYFISKCQVILNAATNGMQVLEAQEIAKVLQILNSISSANDEKLVDLQIIEELLVAAVGLLRTIHALSKEQGNEFSMLLKIADLEAQDNTEIQNHPGFGFKAELVRLIGNMCWRNRSHQDTARDLGAIPLILDCCNIDARNPLIIQWAVLAMRNICENNMENQRVVASVDQQGELDKGRLADLGLLFNGAGR